MDLRAKPVFLHAERVRVAAGDVMGLEDRRPSGLALRKEGSHGQTGHARADDQIVEIDQTEYR